MFQQEKKYFTVEEANEMLPEVEATFHRIFQMRTKIQEVYSRLEDRGRAPEGEYFDVEIPDASPAEVADRGMLKGLMETIQDELDRLQQKGCHVKGLNPALVDWYAQDGGREILLCWKLGEDEVSWWHDPEAGFAGRRPVSELGEGGVGAEESSVEKAAVDKEG